ncbi:hypothetical protein HK098_007781 [Nowakowskiella sp. JEL0407]|nr:hypothetical protein HK098_007781 [Nowakowskiella sp. JEL0407]
MNAPFRSMFKPNSQFLIIARRFASFRQPFRQNKRYEYFNQSSRDEINRRRLYIAGGALAFGGIYYISHLETVPISGRRRFNNLSSKREKYVADQAFREIFTQLKDSILPSYHPYSIFVTKVARRIIEVSGMSDVNWQVFVVNSPQINAFVLPGGKIFVFTGILPIAENEDGLAAILGHEIAHQIARHYAERLSYASVFSYLIPLLYFMGFPVSSGLLEFGFFLPISRKAESEADLIGLHLMSAACYDPKASIRMWERMKLAETDNVGLEYLSTHPSHSTRIQKIKQWLPDAIEVRNNNGIEVGDERGKGAFGETMETEDLRKLAKIALRETCPRCAGNGFLHLAEEKHDKAVNNRCKKCIDCGVCEGAGITVGKKMCEGCRAIGFFHPKDAIRGHSNLKQLKCIDCIDCSKCSGLGVVSKEKPPTSPTTEKEPTSQIPLPTGIPNIPGIHLYLPSDVNWFHLPQPNDSNPKRKKRDKSFIEPKQQQLPMTLLQPPNFYPPQLFQPLLPNPMGFAQPFNPFIPMSQQQQQMSFGVPVFSELESQHYEPPSKTNGPLISANATKTNCPKCDGKGFRHESDQKHDGKPDVKCKACVKCKVCVGTGDITGKMPCKTCNVAGFVHENTERGHDAPAHLRCFFCRDCRDCSGAGVVKLPPPQAPSRKKSTVNRSSSFMPKSPSPIPPVPPIPAKYLNAKLNSGNSSVNTSPHTEKNENAVGSDSSGNSSFVMVQNT